MLSSKPDKGSGSRNDLTFFQNIYLFVKLTSIFFVSLVMLRRSHRIWEGQYVESKTPKPLVTRDVHQGTIYRSLARTGDRNVHAVSY